MLRRPAVLVALLVLVAVPSTLRAQEPAASLAEFQQWIRLGDRVTVTDTSGRHVTGNIAALRPDSLALALKDGLRDFMPDSIRTITRREQDSLRNGALIGLGVGIGLFGLAFAASDGCAYESDCAALVVIGSAFYGGIGAAIGVGVDALHGRETVIFRGRDRGVRLGVSPRLSPGRQAVVVSVAF
jgi:hypothetical protein